MRGNGLVQHTSTLLHARHQSALFQPPQFAMLFEPAAVMVRAAIVSPEPLSFDMFATTKVALERQSVGEYGEALARAVDQFLPRRGRVDAVEAMAEALRESIAATS